VVGKYEVLGLLGEGAMGVVYRARDPEIGRIVAIKTLRRDTLESCPDLPTLYDEARSAGRLRHPHIVTIYDIFTLHDVPHIVMEFVDGRSLELVIQSSGRLSPVRVIDILAKLADALDYAHTEGILHCDIKPSNVLLSTSEEPLILDFGIASVLGSRRGKGGAVVGTPSYMSPEQILGHSLDGRSDIFSLAVVAFECFSAENPFVGEDHQRTLSNILVGNRFALGTFEPSLPLALDAEFERAFSVNSQDRHGTCREMVAAFAGAIGLPSPYRVSPIVGGKTSSEALAALKGSHKSTPSVAAYSSERLSVPSYSENELIPLSGLRKISMSRSQKLFSDYQSTQRARTFKKLSLVLGLLALSLGGYIALELTHDNDIDSGSTFDSKKEVDFTVYIGQTVSVARPLASETDGVVMDLILSSATSAATRIEALREAATRPIPLFTTKAEQVLQEGDYRTRIEVVRTVGVLQDKNSLKVLYKALADRDPVVRKEAAVVLGEFNDPQAEQILRERIIREREEGVVEAIRYALTQPQKTSQ
jgi:serine/threonine protein kinase